MSNSENNCGKCQSTITRTSITNRRKSDLCDRCYDLKYIRKCTICDSIYNIKTSYKNIKWNYVNLKKTTLITDDEKEAKCYDCHLNGLVRAICMCCREIYGHINDPGRDKKCIKCIRYFVLGQQKEIDIDTHNDFVLEFHYDIKPGVNYPFHGVTLYAPICKLQFSNITDDMKNNPLNYIDPTKYSCAGFRTSFGTRWWSFKNLVFRDLKIVPYP